MSCPAIDPQVVAVVTDAVSTVAGVDVAAAVAAAAAATTAAAAATATATAVPAALWALAVEGESTGPVAAASS